MLINLSPVRSDETLMMDREGDMIMLNGAEFDFSRLTEGATLPISAIDSPWFAGPVERVSGELVLTLILPHGADAPESVRFPQPIRLLDDGSVDLPGLEALPEPQPEQPLPVEEPEDPTPEPPPFVPDPEPEPWVEPESAEQEPEQ